MLMMMTIMKIKDEYEFNLRYMMSTFLLRTKREFKQLQESDKKNSFVKLSFALRMEIMMKVEI